MGKLLKFFEQNCCSSATVVKELGEEFRKKDPARVKQIVEILLCEHSPALTLPTSSSALDGEVTAPEIEAIATFGTLLSSSRTLGEAMRESRHQAYESAARVVDALIICKSKSCQASRKTDEESSYRDIGQPIIAEVETMLHGPGKE